MTTAPARSAAHRSGPSIEEIRERFPSLGGPTVFLDNAGGSQAPRVVADRVRDFMLGSYVQLGAEYAESRRAKETVDSAHAFVATLMTGDPGAGEVVMGSSCSTLCKMLAECYAGVLRPEDSEIIVAEAGHEANVGPWARLAERGFTVKTWPIDRGSMTFTIDGLRPLLTERTRVVAFPQVSNVFGEIVDVRPMVDLCHAVGARTVVDGVAYASHRAMDAAALDTDWYVFSAYKVYGPHVGGLFGKHAAFAELEGPGHFFIDRRNVRSRFELGGVAPEACAGLLGVRDYIGFLAGLGNGDDVDRAAVERAFGLMTELELPLQERLMGYLGSKPGVRLIGPRTADESRVSTVSFTRPGQSSAQIARAANAEGMGIRHGNFCSYRLCEALGIDPADGVVRASMVHYNTLDEVDRLIGVLDRVLEG